MSDRREWKPRRRREQAETPNLLVQIGAGLGALGKLLFGGGQRSRFNNAQLLTEYAQIEQLLDSGDAIHAAQAMVRADSFLDSIMQQAGGQGPTFADRLRSLESRFGQPLYQQLWDAHKLRNDVAHNHGLTVSTGQAAAALQTFRRAASRLGAF